MKKHKKFLVGGVKEIEGKWHTFLDTHCPCDGTEKHLSCVVIDSKLSPPYDTQAQAIEILYQIKDESGLKGWETIGAKS